MDKPTLKEFIRYRSGRYVRTEDGRYYVIRNKAALALASLPVIVILLSLVMLPILRLIWEINILSDVFTALYVLSCIYYYFLFYRIAKFTPIGQYSEEYQKALGKPIYKHLWITKIIVATLFIVVLSINSYSLAYLRSLTDTPVAECRFKTVIVSTKDDDRSIQLHTGSDETVSIWLRVLHTQKTPRLLLDGEAVNANDISHYSNYWFKDDYFSRLAFYYLDAEDIRDGSVLTLSCGDWQYEWTFSIR